VSERPRAIEAEPEGSLLGSEQRYRAVSELTSDYAYVTRLTEDGSWELEWITDAFERVTGYAVDSLNDMGVMHIVHPDDLPRIAEATDRLMAGEDVTSDMRIVTKSGEVRWVSAHSRPLLDPETGRLKGAVGAARDITEAKRAEAALRESERRFRALATTAPVGIFEVDLRGACSFLNEQAAEIFGKPAAESRGFGWMEDVHPEDLERLQERWVEGRERGEEIVHELRVVGVDGRVRWIEGAGRPLVDAWGEIRGYIGTLTDITERRHGEHNRRRLLADLVQAQEDERRRIATEIHDDPVQAMTAVGMRLESLRRRLNGPGEAEALDEVAGTVQETVARLRRLLFELRPPGLDRERLAAALKTQLERLRDETGVRFELDDQMLREQPLESRTVLYRIAQEALANVRKHAGATAIHVTLADREEGALLRIRDNGVGFDLDTVDEERSGHLGLVSMRERAEMAGGWFRVAGSEGRGTIVEAWVPTEESA
jgi:PAS domain S-box-containing protein